MGVTAGRSGCGTAVGSQTGKVLQFAPKVGAHALQVAQAMPQVVSVQPKVAQVAPQVAPQSCRQLPQLWRKSGWNPQAGLHSANETVLLMASRAAAAIEMCFLNMMFTSESITVLLQTVTIL